MITYLTYLARLIGCCLRRGFALFFNLLHLDLLLMLVLTAWLRVPVVATDLLGIGAVRRCFDFFLDLELVLILNRLVYNLRLNQLVTFIVRK